MAGSDLPPSSGGSPPPRTPVRRAGKRKRGDGDGDGDESAVPAPRSLPSRETRSAAAAREAMAAAAQMARSALWAARRAAAGALWTARTGRGSGSGGGLGLGVERMREVILEVRAARSELVPNDIAYSLYPRECVGIGVKYQASVPELLSKKEAADYRATTLQKQGTIVRLPATNKPEKMRKKRVDKCDCPRPGSQKCVRVHITKAKVWIQDQLGKKAFRNCGLDAMGEQAVELWTTADKKKLEDLGKSIPRDKYRNFMRTALEEFSTKDLAKYYYNVFLPRRLARVTRAQRKKDEAVDMADEISGLDEDSSEHRPRKKHKSSGSSSTRCKKKKDLTSGPTVKAQRKKN
ncbi:unnamed protein product [Alopecurus aequalis]